MPHVLICGLPASGKRSLKNLLECVPNSAISCELMPIGQLKQTLTNLDPIIPSCIIYILRRGRITDAMDHFAVSDRNYIFNTTLPTILFISHCDYPSHYGWWEENKIFAAKFGIIPTIPVILGSLRNPDQCRQIEQGSVAAVRAETKRKLIDAIRTNSGTEWIPPMQNHLRNKWKFWESLYLLFNSG
ncbi:uncharacterized protein LOC110861598 isoform X2 [Folsomia candida]|uniref:Uncharacterized protein n=1 Tax=Folsomia candida TaxID=158441 RepID=A0A226D1E4_FOLCA|nr:uncharacterized protein LOC110861598 isoform X2 [Folsomia candida]OXA38880.1 hypothetical protein Fcan01_26432 [Folsomia candida]